jgi:bifunctional ADP-heptose synthase (sugar kinase/adenylyltransferase)
LSQVIQPHHSSNVLLIGDSCYDRYFFGTCERLSPEAPVPVLKLDHVETRPGMVLNVAANIKGLGLETRVICASSTITKDRFIDTARMTHLLRVDAGESLSCEKFNPFSLSNINWDSISAVVISDYDKGFLKIDDIACISKVAATTSIPVFIDTKKRDLSLLNNVIIKLNNIEASRLIKQPGKDCELIVTHGSDGAFWRNQWFKPEPVQMFDVCGAGDTFMAGLVVSYLRTGNIASSIEYANKCARIAVQHFGTHAITTQEVT